MPMTLLKQTPLATGDTAEFYVVQSITLNPDTQIATLKCELYVSEVLRDQGSAPAKTDVFINVDYSDLAAQSAALKSAFTTKAQAVLDAQYPS